MEFWRVGRPVVADLHYFEEDTDTDPRWSEESDPDPNRNQKSDPYLFHSEKKDQDPVQIDADPQHCFTSAL